MKNASGQVLYVGKAGNLKRRVSSYFLRPHDSRIEKLVQEIIKIDYEKTDTALEALILEAKLIKELEPPYNIREKDDKSFLYVEITKDKFPRVMLVRGKEKEEGKRFGPFTSAGSIREALRVIRRIFPFSTHNPRELGKFKRPCFDNELGLCPGTCVEAMSRKDYLKNIKHLKLFFSGKKEKIIKNLELEMKSTAKKLEFEKATKLRGQLFSLKHIQDVAFISDDKPDISTASGKKSYRIEGYDISNISGTSAVGAMVVFINDKPARDHYRKFKIQTIHTPNDVGMLREMLERRFHHREWPLPELVLIDGGKGQVNAAKSVLDGYGFRIPVVGIAKGAERKRNDLIGVLPKSVDIKTLIKVRDAAHRFAITYHKEVRRRW